MAYVSKNHSNSIFPLKYVLLSVLFLFMAVIMVLYVPKLLELFVSGLPLAFTTLRSWLTPPYLYVVVNFIIIAIVASSRFQQKIDEGITTEVVAPLKIQGDANKDYPYDVVRNNSEEYRLDYEAIKPEMYGHFEGKKTGVKTMKKPKELEVKTKKRPVEAKPEFEDVESSKTYGHMEANGVDLKINKKPVESRSKFEVMQYENMKARSLDLKTKKKVVEPMMEFEVSKPMKYGLLEAKDLPVNNKMEIPMDYSFSEEKGLISNSSGYQEKDEVRLQAGKEVSATASEENDTLDGTWKMIMESRNAEASMKADKGNNLRIRLET